MLPPMVFPVHVGEPDPISIGVPLFWYCRLPVMTESQTWFPAPPAGRLCAWRLPLMVADGPIEKLPPFCACTLPFTTVFVSDRLPPSSRIFPVITPPMKTQFWPAEIVKLP